MDTEKRIIFADKNLIELGFLKNIEADIEVGKENDFEIKMDADSWDKRLTFDSYAYVPDTEFGGIVKEIESDTSTNMIYARGYTFRGILEKKVIEPPKGQDYKVVSGNVDAIVRELLEEQGLLNLFAVSDMLEPVEIGTFRIDRYITLLEGLKKVLASVNHRLSIAAVRDETRKVYVRIRIVPIHDFSEELEFSQDGKLNLIATDNRRGINHLICLGKGELKDRIVKHLYVQKNGTIGEEKYYTGIEERTETYDNNNAEVDELMKNGTEKLQERMNSKTFKTSVRKDEEGVYEIGDILAGRDYVTGTTVKKPIVGKIYTYQSGEEEIEYKIEGDD